MIILLTPKGVEKLRTEKQGLALWVALVQLIITSTPAGVGRFFLLFITMHAMHGYEHSIPSGFNRCSINNRVLDIARKFVSFGIIHINLIFQYEHIHTNSLSNSVQYQIP